MGATFARLKVWVAWEVLTHTDQNAEFDNFLDNLTPAGVDDASVSVAAMRTTTDPYPGSAESQATSLEGEIQRLRYVIAQLSGKTYWYQDPGGAANLKLFMNAGATAPEWAAGIKIGTFTRSMATATGDVSYTGVGFKPSHIVFFGAWDAAASLSMGLSNGSAHYVVYTIAAVVNSNPVFCVEFSNGPTTQYADVHSLDSDGFTLSWTLTGAGVGQNANVFYIAFR